MKLRKVISGGQTGADRTGLECATALGLETGGYAPSGYRTDEGPDPALKDFGLIETQGSDYRSRTYLNAKSSDVTLWFGRINSPGYYCTRNACDKYGVQLITNPSELQIEALCRKYETWNVAGNRKRINPGVVPMVQAAFDVVKRVIGAQAPTISPPVSGVEGA
jgi:hypothetical protein